MQNTKLGLNYFSPEEIKSKKTRIQDFFNEEAGSPILKEGKALEIVQSLIPRGAKLLECGPGTGFLLAQLKEDGYTDLNGVDIDNYLQDSTLCDLKTLDFSFEKLPWPNAHFDAVVSFETIEHLENPYYFIRELHRVLKPEGTLVLSMPNIQHIFNKIFFLRKGDMPRWRKNNNHLWVYPRGVFQKAFRNFQLIETRYFKGFFPYRQLSKLPIWPETELFAHTAIFVFKPVSRG